jgi:hypothetical protein
MTLFFACIARRFRVEFRPHILLPPPTQPQATRGCYILYMHLNLYHLMESIRPSSSRRRRKQAANSRLKHHSTYTPPMAVGLRAQKGQS